MSNCFDEIWQPVDHFNRQAELVRILRSSDLCKPVEAMFKFNSDVNAVAVPQGREQNQREIVATDRWLDRQECGLYRLAEEESTIVEGASG